MFTWVEATDKAIGDWRGEYVQVFPRGERPAREEVSLLSDDTSPESEPGERRTVPGSVHSLGEASETNQDVKQTLISPKGR
jgi:hypothetical protein